MSRLALWLGRRAMQRRMRINHEHGATLQHGYRRDDRVATPLGPGTVWMADMKSSWVITVELDVHPAPGQWWADFAPDQLERIRETC